MKLFGNGAPLLLALLLPAGLITAQSVANETMMTVNEAGARVVQVNDRIMAIDGRVWTTTNWSVTALLLAEVMHGFDNVADSLRSTPIHLYSAALPSVNRSSPQLVERGGNTDIYLTAGRNYWCQFVYQFAHEYLHYLVGRTYDTDDRFGWFEESLAELASLYALERMGTLEFRNPRLEAYKHYFPAYAREAVATNDYQPTAPLLEFLPSILDDLEKDRYDRAKNRAIAERLLPYFLDNPRLWGAVPYLREVDGAACADFRAYVNRWQALLPEGLRSGVRELTLFQ